MPSPMAPSWVTEVLQFYRAAVYSCSQCQSHPSRSHTRPQFGVWLGEAPPAVVLLIDVIPPHSVDQTIRWGSLPGAMICTSRSLPMSPYEPLFPRESFYLSARIRCSKITVVKVYQIVIGATLVSNGSDRATPGRVTVLHA